MTNLVNFATPGGGPLGSVVFVHGLNGDARETWRCDNRDDCLWPQWLADDLPGLGVISAGYEASPSNWTGNGMHPKDRASNMLERLLMEPSLQAGPIAFVTHSLGGLVVKEMLRQLSDRANIDQAVRLFVDRITKVVFFSTPHNGSEIANVADALRAFVRPSAATLSLKSDDPNLRELNSWYRNWSNNEGIDHLVFTETRKTGGAKIVSQGSGDPGLLNVIPIPIDADHFGICKPLNRKELAYLKVMEFLKTPRPKRSSKSKPSYEQNNDPLSKLAAAVADLARTVGLGNHLYSQLAARVDQSDEMFATKISNLERDVKIVSEVIREVPGSTSGGDEIEETLIRVAELSADARNDEAAREVDKALARWEEKQEKQTKACLRLLEAGIKQDILRRDASAVAVRTLNKINLQNTDKLSSFDVLLDEQDKWFIFGRDKSSLFDLEIAVNIARLAVDTAPTVGRRGAALMILGASLSVLGQRDNRESWYTEAVLAANEAILSFPRGENAKSWAMAMDLLGTVLLLQGKRESDPAKIERAISVYKCALEVRQVVENVIDWAATTSNLATALSSLGKYEKTGAKLEESVALFQSLLKVRTKGDNFEHWATTQNNFGNVLSALGERIGSPSHVADAVAAYKAVLEGRSRELVPQDWAVAQDNYGSALKLLGQMTKDANLLVIAVAAHSAALEEMTRSRAPLEWARIQSNLGVTLFALGEMESNIIQFKKAVWAYRSALTERPLRHDPSGWATTQNNLGNALSMIGDLEQDRSPLLEAVDAYTNALSIRRRDHSPLEWSETLGNRGSAYRILGQLEMSVERLNAAASTFREALEEARRECAPMQWARLIHGLGQTLRLKGELTQDLELVAEAVEYHRAALLEWTCAAAPMLWAGCMGQLGECLGLVGCGRRNVEMLTEGRQAIVLASEVIASTGNREHDRYYMSLIERFDEALHILRVA